MDILRFITAGSVDDGKSTLIGRLLFDTKSILDDQMEAIQKASKQKGEDEIDLALLTDGLRAEREQGITIDVAYKYFNTARRKFINADAPGHIQYTRNMITGASNSQLAVILVDARNGVIEQTRRHTFLAYLLGLKHVVVAINKMDLLNYDEAAFQKIVEDYKAFAKPLEIQDMTFIPVSALNGDNVVEASQNMPWYQGKTLLKHLEEVEVQADENLDESRFQVQYVIRPQSEEYHDYRGYAGKVLSGIYKSGDEVQVLPSGIATKIKEVEVAQQKVAEVFAPMSVVLHLEDDIDVSRGDLIVKTEDAPATTQEFKATLCWLDEKALKPRGKYMLVQNSQVVPAVVKSQLNKINIQTLEEVETDEMLKMNDIGTVEIKLASPLALDTFAHNNKSGRFILIDAQSNNTVGAGMVKEVL